MGVNVGTRLRAAIVALVIALLLCGQSRIARAADDTPSPDAAVDELKRRGDDALVAGRHAEALALYEEAYAKNPNPALLYNEGRAYEALGNFPKALDKLEEFDTTAPEPLRARVPLLASLIKQIRLKVSTLALTCNVDGAHVRVGGHDVGPTPLRPLRVLAGDHVSVEIERDGYLVWRRELTFKGAAVTLADARLAKRATEGILVVRSPVVGAHVSVDGKAEGTTPSELVVREGSHRVDMDYEGYKRASTIVLVGAGDRKEVDVDLAREASILTRWWFWTAVGVVAVGTVITVYALTKERDPDSGNIAPGRINAGLHF